MRIKIKTASKEADIAIISMLRTDVGQIVLLTYSAGMYIMLEYIGANILSPLFPLESAIELDKLLKLNVDEKDNILHIGIERASEADLIKTLNAPIYNVYYRRKEKYYDLIKFENENAEENSNMFFQNISPNLLVMQPIDLDSYFDLDSILERIQAVGMKNITKFEKEYLQRISKQDNI